MHICALCYHAAVGVRRLPTNDFDVVVAKHVAQELRRSVSEEPTGRNGSRTQYGHVTDTVRLIVGLKMMKSSSFSTEKGRQVKSPWMLRCTCFKEKCLVSNSHLGVGVKSAHWSKKSCCRVNFSLVGRPKNTEGSTS